MKNRHVAKRLFALFLAAAMVVDPAVPTLEAYAQELADKELEEQKLREWAASQADAYPDGGYEFLEGDQKVSEDAGDIMLTVIRKGDTSRADSVEIKAVDVTAYYGSDYRMYVKQNGEYVEAGSKKEEEPEQQSEEEKAETDNTEGTEETNEEVQTPESGASGSILKKIKKEKLGITEERKNWREQLEEINDAQAVAASMEAENELINAADGKGLVLEFAEGEFKKEIRIEIIDDDYSESDESAWIGLGNAKLGMMAEKSQIKLDIKDNEKEEPITFAMKSAEVITAEDQSTAKVTIERTTGIHSYAVATINTSAGSAQPNEDYLPINNKQVIFPAEVTEQTVEIALLGERSEASQFVVSLDENAAKVEEGKSRTIVTIAGASKDEVQGQAEASYYRNKKDREGNYTVVGYTNFDEHGGNKEEWRYWQSWTGFGDFLKAADKMHVDYNMHGKSKTGAIWYYDKTISLDIGDRQVASRSVSDKKSNYSVDGSWDIWLTAADHNQNKIQQNVYTGWWNNTNYMKIKQMNFYLPDYSISFDNSNATYFPKTYTTTKNYTTSSTAVTLGKTPAAGALSYDNWMYIGVNNLNSEAYVSEYQLYFTKDPAKRTIHTFSTWDTYLSYGKMVDIWNGSPWAYKVSYGKDMTIRPVYKVYPAAVKFTSKNDLRATYDSGSFKNGDVLSCTLLDKITVNAKGAGNANQGLKVNSIRLRGMYFREKEINKDTLDNAVKSAWQYRIKQSKQGGEVTLSETFDIDRNYNVVEVLDQETTLKVYYDKDELNHKDELSGKLMQDMGSVILSEGSASSVSSAKNWKGDWKTDILLHGVKLGQPYMTSAITADGGDGSDIKANWTYKDEKGEYQTVRGNNFVFRPYFSDTDIAYYFERVQRNMTQVNVSGTVQFEEVPLFSNSSYSYRTKAYGVKLNIGGQNVTTDKDGNYTTDKVFNKGEVVGIYLEYGDIYQIDTVNTSKNRKYNPVVKVNENDGIQFDNSTMTKIYKEKNGGVGGAALNAVGAYTTYEGDADILYLEDNTYTLKMQVSGKNCKPASVEMKVYNSKGALKKEFTQSAKVVNGKDVTFKMNPKAVATTTAGVTKSLEVGDQITMTAYDDKGKAYFEHHTSLVVTEPVTSMYMFNYNAWKSDTDNLFVKAMGNLTIGYDTVIDGLSGDLGTYRDASGNAHQLYGFGFGSGFKSTNSKVNYSKNAYTTEQAIIEEIRNTGTSKETFEAHDSFALAGDAKDGAWALEIQIGVIMDTLQGNEQNGKTPGKMYFSDYVLVGKASASYSKSWEFSVGVADVELSLGFGVRNSGITWHFWADEYNSEIAAGNSTINLLEKYADTSEGALNIDAFIKGEAFAGKKGVVGVQGSVEVYVQSHNALKAKTWSNTGVVTIKPEVDVKVAIIKIPVWKSEYNVEWGKAKAASLDDIIGESLSTANMLEVSSEHPVVISRDYLNHTSAWMGTDAASAYSIEESSGITSKDLKTGIYSEAQIALQDLGNNKYLAVIVDDDKTRDEYNRGALYYSLSQDGGVTWSTPVLLDDDGTLDQLPSIQYAGSKGYMVAWTDANRPITSEDTTLDMLNSYNISAKFFNPDTMAFGDEMEITKNTEWDKVSDTNPQVVYVEADPANHVFEQLMVYYTKSEYEATNPLEGEVAGDVLHPDSLVAYRTYDFTKDKWVDTYSVPDPQEGYTANMYGQEFLKLAPVAKVTEEIDPKTGYWKAGTTAQVEAYGEGKDAVVTDTEGIGYNHLSLFAYVLDEDGETITTKDDKNIYLQIHNFKEDTTHHPILLTTKKGEISNLQFVRTELGTFLYWLQDGEIYKQNISKLVKNNLKEVTAGSEQLYIVDRSEPAEDAEGYEDPILVAAMDNSLEDTRLQVETTEENAEEVKEIIDSIKEPETNESEINPDAAITSFTTKMAGDYIYTVWTGQKAVAVEGDETQFENQLYVCRESLVGQDSEKEDFDANQKCYEATRPVQITSAANNVFQDQDFIVKADGSMCAMASQFRYNDIAGQLDTANGILTVLSFNPTKAVTIKEVEPGTIVQKETEATEAAEGKEDVWQLPVTITLENSSVEKITAGKVHVSSTDEVIDYSAIGGEKKKVVVNVPVDAKGNYDATITVEDASGTLATQKISGQVAVDLAVKDFSVQLNERNRLDISANVTNEYGIRSDASKVTFGYLDDNGKEISLKSFDVPALSSGEQMAILENVGGSFDTIFADAVLNEEGNYVSNRKFFLKSSVQDTPTVYFETGLQISKDQMDVINETTSLEPQLSRTIKVGEAADTCLKVNGGDAVKPAYEGLRVVWQEDNAKIVEVKEDGSVLALKAGTTELTGYVMPDNSDRMLSEDGLGVDISNYPTMPGNAMKKVSLKITVPSDQNNSSDDPSSNIPVKPEEKPDTGEDKTPSEEDKTPTDDKEPATVVKVNKTKITGISGEAFTYTGKSVKPSFKVTYKGKKLVLNKDYTVKFLSNKKVGKATAVITGIGDYSGTQKVTFTIVPAKVKAGISADKKTLSWKKVDGATGYVVYYSTKKSGGYKKLAATKKQKVSVTESKKLKSGKVYYFKVRAYGKDDGKNYYGSYSAVSKCKVK